MASENTALQIAKLFLWFIAMLFHLIIMELNSSNPKASDQVQNKRPIEAPGFLISLILLARLAFWGYLFTIRDFSSGQN